MGATKGVNIHLEILELMAMPKSKSYSAPKADEVSRIFLQILFEIIWEIDLKSLQL